jgi:hypothetical protein
VYSEDDIAQAEKCRFMLEPCVRQFTRTAIELLKSGLGHVENYLQLSPSFSMVLYLKN